MTNAPDGQPTTSDVSAPETLDPDGMCEECGNDIATVIITNGQRVCLDCAEELDP